MNMRLLILSLIALLGLGSTEPAEVNAGSSGDLSLSQEKQLLDQQHQAGGTTKDWNDLWENYHQYQVSEDEDDEDDYEDKYKDKLKVLTPKDVDKDVFKSKAKDLLKALEAVQKQEDALTQSFVTHSSKIQQLDQDKKSHNQRTGRQ